MRQVSTLVCKVAGRTLEDLASAPSARLGHAAPKLDRLGEVKAEAEAVGVTLVIPNSVTAVPSLLT